jgi:hypothetical protein
MKFELRMQQFPLFINENDDESSIGGKQERQGMEEGC